MKILIHRAVELAEQGVQTRTHVFVRVVGSLWATEIQRVWFEHSGGAWRNAYPIEFFSWKGSDGIEIDGVEARRVYGRDRVLVGDFVANPVLSKGDVLRIPSGEMSVRCLADGLSDAR